MTKLKVLREPLGGWEKEEKKEIRRSITSGALLQSIVMTKIFYSRFNCEIPPLPKKMKKKKTDDDMRNASQLI